jgi:hypothetical protein
LHEGTPMSFSFRLPEEDPTCECKYDEVRDRMDWEDCPFHGHILEEEAAEVLEADRKPPVSVGVPGSIVKRLRQIYSIF